MKTLVLAVLLTSVSLFVQGQAQEPPRDQTEIALNTAGCGPSQVSFDASVDKNQHPLVQAEQGKALVYIISSAAGVIKVGVDGSWVGATSYQSYFSFQVSPGDHHLCMSLQRDHKQGSAISFTTIAGQVHYFRLSVQDFFWKLKEIDPAQGQFLIASAPLSTSRPKK